MDYYVRLEQGRCPNVSDAVLAALARALGLTPVERSYLFAVARPPAPALHGRDISNRHRPVHPAFELLLRTVRAPAMVLGWQHDVLAINRPGLELFNGLGAARNCLHWLVVDSRSQAVCVDWELAVRDAVATLRVEAARRPHDPRLNAMVNELATHSDAFQRFWREHHVDVAGAGPRRYMHATTGRIVLARTRLVVRDDCDQTLLIDGGFRRNHVLPPRSVVA